MMGGDQTSSRGRKKESLVRDLLSEWIHRFSERATPIEWGIRVKNTGKQINAQGVSVLVY
jgi:hypothetical protein